MTDDAAADPARGLACRGRRVGAPPGGRLGGDPRGLRAPRRAARADARPVGGRGRRRTGRHGPPRLPPPPSRRSSGLDRRRPGHGRGGAATGGGARCRERRVRRGGRGGAAVRRRLVRRRAVPLRRDAVPDCVSAARELGRVVRPAGRIAVAVWAEGERNQWMTVIGRAALRLGLIDRPDPEAPGPFRLAAPGRLRASSSRQDSTSQHEEEVAVTWRRQIARRVVVDHARHLEDALAARGAPRRRRHRATAGPRASGSHRTSPTTAAVAVPGVARVVLGRPCLTRRAPRDDGRPAEAPAPQAGEWREPDLNRRHHGFQPCALPTELPRRGRPS